MSPAPSALLATVKAAGWSCSAQRWPRHRTYRLQHGCGLSFEIDTAFAENASDEDTATMARAMAASVQFTTSQRES